MIVFVFQLYKSSSFTVGAKFSFFFIFNDVDLCRFDFFFQGLLFLLCALCPPDVSKVRVGKLTPYGMDTLRNIRDFLGVKFVIKPDPTTNTLVLKCVGCGMKNLSRKVA